jgi:hypothetical protein
MSLVLSIFSATSLSKANWGCHGSEVMAIPFINFTAVSECIKDDTIISQFKLTATGLIFTIPLADRFYQYLNSEEAINKRV